MSTGSALIPAHWDIAVWLVMLALAGVGWWSESTRSARFVPGMMIAMLIATVLSNTRVIPFHAPAYDFVSRYFVIGAIPLLLLKADLRVVFSQTSTLIWPFLIGCVGTLIGTWLAVWLAPLDGQGVELAAALCAQLIGGVVNYVAVGTILDLNPSLMATALTVSNIVGVAYLMLMAVLPSLKILKGWPRSSAMTATAGGSAGVDDRKQRFNLVHAGIALMLSLGICAIGYVLADVLALRSYALLFVTAITITVATFFGPWLRGLTSHFEIGMALLYVFFVVVGAGTQFLQMLAAGLPIFVFVTIIYLAHVLVLFAVGRWLKMDLPSLIIASIACASGPGPAAALAAGQGWHRLVTPGVTCALLGYAIANFLGIAVARLLA